MARSIFLVAFGFLALFGTVVACAETEQILFVSNRHPKMNLYVMDEDGANVRRVTAPGMLYAYPQWSEDGTRILCSMWNGQLTDIRVIDTKSGNALSVIARAESPAWSPDETRIAFTCFNGSRDICVADVNGGNVRRLTNEPERWNDEHPTWSPDGQSVAFSSNRDPKFWRPAPEIRGGFLLTQDIYTMNLNGGELRNLTQTLDQERDPAWSPDGMEIAYVRYEGDAGALYIVNVSTEKARRVLLLNDSVSYPSWSSDSSKILFGSKRSLYIIDRDGKNLKRLTNHDGDPGIFDGMPKRKPTPRDIAAVGKLPVTWGTIKRAVQ